MITPILNVSNFADSLAWFEKLGWSKQWDWGTPPVFGCVRAGRGAIFLCQGAQGGQGKSSHATTKGPGEYADKGVWLWILVDDVDKLHQHCLNVGIEVTFPPTNEPWGSREMHIRHPDGHVLRLAQGIEEEEPCKP